VDVTGGNPEALGGHRELAGKARLVGDAIFVAALLVTVALERLQFQLRAAESSRWWASNGRDMVNALALCTMALGLRMMGFTGPIAFLLAASMVVNLTATQPAFQRAHHGALLTLAFTLTMGAPILIWPDAVDHLSRGLLKALFH
jgi:hypothetical protein